MACFCCLRDKQDKLGDKKLPYERRYGTQFDGATTPFLTLGADIYLESHLYERQASSALWCKYASRNIHRVRAEFWRRLDGRLDHRGRAL